MNYPRLKALEEENARLKRIVAQQALDNELLREWEDFYNYNRLHAAPDGQTPYERFREKAKLTV